MSKQYRLTPKPGVVRAGRIVNTKVTPTIVPGHNNVLKATPIKAQQPKKVVIKKPIKKEPPRRKRSPVRAQPARPSALRRKKDVEIGRYKKLVEALKNCGSGRILIMVACGPSIMEVDLPRLQKHPLIDIMSINKPDPRIHPTKYWVFCDQSQYTRNKDTFDNYRGTVINAWSVRARHRNQILIKNRSGKGFSKNLLQGYYIGRSTTFANMQTAYWMNYDKVFIFGCDMCKPPGADNLHFYGRNEDVDPTIRAKRFAKEAEHYDYGAKQMNSVERKKFVFCSAYNPWPFVKQFESMDHAVAVDRIWDEADKKLTKNNNIGLK